MLAGIYRKYFFVLLLVLLPAVSHAQATLININVAGSSELQTLNGIGPAYAQRIIDYRNTSGLFKKIEDIMNVSGIKDNIFSKIKDYITVGSPDATTSTTTTETTATSTVPATSSGGATPNISIVIISTHYSAAPLTNIETDTKFEIGAGRPRMSTVGTPIEFNANTNASYTKNLDFKWSFGDGTTGAGQILTHNYPYPGEYVVVLNATSPDGIAVSRTDVSIVPVDLSIAVVELSRIEVMNNSSREVNLYGRALMAGSKVFTFPQDTIIKAGQKISFGANVTGLDFSEQPSVSLVVVGTEVKPQQIMAQIEEQRLEQIAQIHGKILILQQQLTARSREQSIAQSTGATVEKLVEPENSESQTATVISAVSNSSDDSKGNWFQVLKRFFLRTQ